MTDSAVAIRGAGHVAAGRRVLLERADPGGAKPAGGLLTVGEQSVGRRVVVSVDGELDISNAAELRAAIENAGSRAFEIWLDLSATTFMDSSALHAIAQARDRLGRANVGIALICPDGPILRLLKLTGFDRMFPIHVSRTAANHATAA
jgi:anti-anti-sigma factor